MPLPHYAPPETPRTCLAVGLAPLLVLLAFTAVVTRVIDVDTVFACLLACGIWVIHEMHVYQKAIDTYNAEYVRAHLAWRSTASLSQLVDDTRLNPPTREFVQRFVDAGCVLLRDGQSV